MGKGKFGRAAVGAIIKTPNEAGGTTVTIEDAFSGETVDYSDTENVKVMATKAVNTANGLYELISKNCDTKEPPVSAEHHLEMFLALAGLACEIYMKSIIYNESRHNGKQLKVHYLDELFEMLPNDIQAELNVKIPELMAAIVGIRDIFLKLRYDFELNAFNGDYLNIFVLMEELKRISNSYPVKTMPILCYTGGKVLIE